MKSLLSQTTLNCRLFLRPQKWSHRIKLLKRFKRNKSKLRVKTISICPAFMLLSWRNANCQTVAMLWHHTHNLIGFSIFICQALIIITFVSTTSSMLLDIQWTNNVTTKKTIIKHIPNILRTVAKHLETQWFVSFLPSLLPVFQTSSSARHKLV